MWELRIDDEVCGEGPLRPFSQRPKYGGQRANERGPGDGDPAEVVVCCGGGAQRRAASGQGQWGGWAGPECVLEHGESDATHLQSRVLGGREGMGLPAWGERQRERRSDRAAAQRDGHWSS
ncbi:hypothetical protein AXG93_3661s1250 [Marchantia polymorpha subsp. ruderalis]|uniref:Uncharacterized protein n=1 Tax=Marchantia polymorpha subsp. ruderalis TaxID=1480154 RepID=A0A176VJP4_MARPO|nr:hypothetical protein AXG93_3661s1250 [Marchantia polymorpha subsp. ruderalis]